MLKLTRLEYKKNNIAKYIRNACIMALILCLFVFANVFLGIANDPDGTLDVVDGKNTVSSMVELFTSIAFLIFTGVMLASFIISAYKDKTMQLMFSYPVKRQKILISKMIAVWFFNFVALTGTKLLLYTCVYIGARSLPASFIVDFNMGSISFYIQLILKSVVLVSMGFIALFAGMAFKSSKAAIITSFLLIFLTQANIGDFSLTGNTVVPVILMVISFVFAGLSVYNVEIKDLM